MRAAGGRRLCRREGCRPRAPCGSGGSVWAGWYWLTSALSLVGCRVLEYPAPQVVLHMACSLLRSIKCQLRNHKKDQRSVFLIRPEFWETSSFLLCTDACLICLKFWSLIPKSTIGCCPVSANNCSSFSEVEFGVFSDPLPVRPADRGLLQQMVYCSGL